MFMADLHVHSTFSDGKMTIPELVDFYGERGFGCLAVTDHVCEEATFLGKAANYLGRSLTSESMALYFEILREEAARAWDQYRMVLIPGVELTKNSWSNHRSAHILGLGVHAPLGADGDVLGLIGGIHDQGALAVAAHPVSTRRFEPQTYHLWDRRRELASHFDAWEVASGPCFFDEVYRSGLPMLASSDLHRPSQISSWKTTFRCERHAEAILHAIKSQDVDFCFYQDRAAQPCVLSEMNGNACRVGGSDASLAGPPFILTIS